MRKKSTFLITGVLAVWTGIACPTAALATMEVPSLEVPSGQESGNMGEIQAEPLPEQNSAPNGSGAALPETSLPQETITVSGPDMSGPNQETMAESLPEAGSSQETAAPLPEGNGQQESTSVPENNNSQGPSGPGAGGNSQQPGVYGPGAGSSSQGPGAGPNQNQDQNQTSSLDTGATVPDNLPVVTDLGMPENANVVSGRMDYFSEMVPNPIVSVVEKYSYDRMVSDLNKLQERYGSTGRIHINELNTTFDGRKMYEVILGNPDAPKHVLIHAGIHAREYMTPLLVMKQLEYGLAFYDQANYEGVPLSTLLQQVAVHFVPMVNPDGISISQFGIDGIRSEELRQQIRQCYENDLAQGRTSAAFDRYLIYWKANGRGVDLNQNFPANWHLVGSCPNPSYASYKGTEPLSEPESWALANLAASRKWSATVSYHSMGNIIYWDYQGNRVTEESRELTSLIQASTGYRPAGSSGNGGFKDWTQIKDDPIPGVTIETGSVACPLPVSQYVDIWSRNKMVWALVAKYAMEH